MKVSDFLPEATTPDGVRLEILKMNVDVNGLRLGEQYPGLPCIVDLGKLGLAEIDLQKAEKIHDLVLADGSLVEAPNVKVELTVYPHGLGNRIMNIFNRGLPEDVHKASIVARFPRAA